MVKTAFLRRLQFAIQEEQLHAECGAKLNNFYLSMLLCIFPSLNFASHSAKSCSSCIANCIRRMFLTTQFLCGFKHMPIFQTFLYLQVVNN